jgi:hypothetical protein
MTQGSENLLSSKDRLVRLRQLVGRLEQLPGSPERDRMLAEVRARAVDLETGVKPRAMLPIEVARLIGEKPVRGDNPPAAARQPADVADVAPLQPAPPQPMPVSIDLLATEERLSLEESSAPHRAWQNGLRG